MSSQNAIYRKIAVVITVGSSQFCSWQSGYKEEEGSFDVASHSAKQVYSKLDGAT